MTAAKDAGQWIRVALRNDKIALADIADLVALAQEALGVVVDGKPGTHTLRALALSRDAVALPSAEMRISRARSVVGRGIKYKLGKGGFDPSTPSPANAAGTCDCSGFASWIMGITRKPSALFGRWIETTNIVRDATGDQDLFLMLEDPRPGSFAVYPDHDGKQGHVALVTGVDPLMGIDCSSSRSKRTGEAIHERSLAFMAKRAIFVVPKSDFAT